MSELVVPLAFMVLGVSSLLVDGTTLQRVGRTQAVVDVCASWLLVHVLWVFMYAMGLVRSAVDAVSPLIALPLPDLLAMWTASLPLMITLRIATVALFCSRRRSLVPSTTLSLVGALVCTGLFSGSLFAAVLVVMEAPAVAGGLVLVASALLGNAHAFTRPTTGCKQCGPDEPRRATTADSR